MYIGNTVMDIERCLETTFLPLSKQYKLDIKNSRNLIHELAEKLLLAQKKKNTTFEKLVSDVAADVSALGNEWTDEVAKKRHFADFQKKAIALANTPPHLNPHKDELTVLLSTASRRIKVEELTKEQVGAIKLVIKYLCSFAVSFKDVVVCTHMFRNAGIEPMLQLGKSVDEYLSITAEEE